MNLLRRDPLHLSLVALIWLAAIALRFTYLDRTMRFDESTTFLRYASQGDFMSNYAEPNNHLLHTLLVHLVYRLFGDSPTVLRLPAFIAGIFIPLAVYIVTRQFYGKHIAPITMALVAVSTALIEFSVNARGYSLLTLITLIELGLAKVLKDQPNRYLWGLFGVLAALGFYTIPIMFLPLGGICLWLLLSLWLEGRRRLLLPFAATMLLGAVLTLLLYLPVFLHDGVAAVTANRYVSETTESLNAEVQEVLYQIPRYASRDIPIPLAVVLVWGLVLAVVCHPLLTRDRVPLLLAFVLWIAPITALRGVVPPDRVWVFLIPLYMMQAAAGITALVQWLLQKLTLSARAQGALFAASALLLMGIIGGQVISSQIILKTRETHRADDVEAVARYLEDHLGEKEYVLASPLDAVILQYYLREHLKDQVIQAFSQQKQPLLIYDLPKADWDAFRVQDRLLEMRPVHSFPEATLFRLSYNPRQVTPLPATAHLIAEEDFDALPPAFAIEIQARVALQPTPYDLGMRLYADFPIEASYSINARETRIIGEDWDAPLSIGELPPLSSGVIILRLQYQAGSLAWFIDDQLVNSLVLEDFHASRFEITQPPDDHTVIDKLRVYDLTGN